MSQTPHKSHFTNGEITSRHLLPHEKDQYVSMWWNSLLFKSTRTLIVGGLSIIGTSLAVKYFFTVTRDFVRKYHLQVSEDVINSISQGCFIFFCAGSAALALGLINSNNKKQ